MDLTQCCSVEGCSKTLSVIFSSISLSTGSGWVARLTLVGALTWSWTPTNACWVLRWNVIVLLCKTNSCFVLFDFHTSLWHWLLSDWLTDCCLTDWLLSLSQQVHLTVSLFKLLETLCCSWAWPRARCVRVQGKVCVAVLGLLLSQVTLSLF